MRIGTRLLCVYLAGALLSGCAANPDKQLERVAKDWCLTIRASQVIPVYPLTEDLAPGDVFLVQLPIKRQHEIYQDKGFLALDQLVARLGGGKRAYEHFYRADYFDSRYGKVPHARPAPTPGDSSGEGQNNSWTDAPMAAFPSYNFRIDRSQGIQLAVPIQGIPLALGLMGSSKAMGSVTIADAYTYGLDGQALVDRIHSWFHCIPPNADPDEPQPMTCRVREEMTRVAQYSDQPIYLRVVTRVYLAGRVDVGLSNLEARSAQADVGAAQQVRLPDLSSLDAEQRKAAAGAYAAALQTLSQPLNEAVPGGSVRFVQASQRAVSMVQTFKRPLVVGYRGFDLRVEPEGELSPPIPSFALLNDLASPGTLDTTPEENRLEQYLTIARLEPDGRDAWFKRAAAMAPRPFRAAFEAALAGSASAFEAFVRAKDAYLGATSSITEREARLGRINRALEQTL